MTPPYRLALGFPAPGFAAAISALAAIACSGAENASRPPEAAPAVRIDAGEQADGDWRLAYEFSPPRASVDFGPAIDGYRARNWLLDSDNEARLVARDGRDRLEAPAEKRLGAAVFTVTPEPVALRKQYEPFIAMGDGGVLLYTGHLLPFDETGERLEARLTIRPGEGRTAVAFGGDAQAGIVDWKSPFDHPAFICVGCAPPIDTGALTLVIDATAPAWIRAEAPPFAGALAKAMEALLSAPPAVQPTIFIASADQEAPGRLSYSGDALPGQYQMTLAGAAWREPSDEARAVFFRSTAHETAHLWQTDARPADDRAPDWINEGGAEALAADALVAAGYWTDAERAADLSRARAVCAKALRVGSLARTEAGEDWEAVYACGHVVTVAAAGEAGVGAFWAEFVRRSAARGYDLATFLALAEERAGPDAAQAIRDLVNINDAQPERVFDRMFAR